MRSGFVLSMMNVPIPPSSFCVNERRAALASRAEANPALTTPRCAACGMFEKTNLSFCGSQPVLVFARPYGSTQPDAFGA